MGLEERTAAGKSTRLVSPCYPCRAIAEKGKRLNRNCVSFNNRLFLGVKILTYFELKMGSFIGINSGAHLS